MKTKRFILMVVAILAGAGLAAAGTNEVSALLQKGLFEEEANRNLDTAIQAYQSVITQTDKDHQFAATAIFRLGECYRKQGKTNEANVQYQRILREFPDQAELVKLSREYAGSSVVVSPPSNQIVSPWLQAQLAMADSYQRQIDEMQRMSLEKRRVFAQQHFPNPVLDSLMQKMTETEQALAGQKASLGEHHPDVERTTAALKTIYQQIDAQVDGIVSGLMDKKNEAAATAAASEKLVKEAGQTSRGGSLAEEQADATAPSEADEIKRLQAMIKDSPDLINTLDNIGSTPLIRAANAGHLAVATFLLENKANIEKRDNNLQTPLINAVVAGHKDMVELLLNKGADVNAVSLQAVPSFYHYSALHYAVKSGQKAIADVLLAHGAKVDAGDNTGRTPLMVAAEKGFKTVAEALLAGGADVNAKDGKGATALFAAVDAGNQAIIESLLARGVNVNEKNTEGKSTLFEAVMAGNRAIVELLLANKGDVNLMAKDGLTPLIAAINAGQSETAAFLLEHGADPNARMADDNPSSPRWTALDAAVARNNNELIKLLLEKHADPNATYDMGDRGNIYERDSTPLILAVKRGQKETAQILLARKADVNWKNSNGVTALLEAVTRDDREMAALLLNNKADTEIKYNIGNPGVRTVLQQVTEQGKKEMAELLLAHGAQVNAQDDTGKTALHLAVSHGSSPMVELLLAHGADVNLPDNQANTALDLAGNQSGYAPSRPLDFHERMNAIVAGASGTQDNATHKSIGELLRQHGAISALERSTIRITRSGQVAQGVVFMQDAHAYNHHTLFEVIAYTYPHQLGLTYFSMTRHRRRDPELPGFYFPDFAHIKIHRLEANGSTNILKIDLEAALNSGDCSRNLDLKWGDTVELPELDHNVSENWGGLAQPIRDTLKKCLERQVEIIVKGKVTKVALAPNLSPVGKAAANTTPLELILVAGTPPKLELACFWLSDVVHSASVLLASSDLTGVKVKRVDPANGKTEWLVFNLERIDEHSDLWLQDGDVIEVPEKQ